MTNIDEKFAVPDFVGRSSTSRKPLELEPTFPLDVEEIRSLREKVICDSPKFLAWQLLAQLGSRFTLLSRFSEAWSKLEPELNSAVVEHVVRQSNIAQDQVIRCLIDVLKDQHGRAYAEILTNFLRVKQTIELALRTNRKLAAQRADVETIVDAIMQEVCNEIFLLSDWESELGKLQRTDADSVKAESLRAAIQRAKDRITQAHDTMVETQEQVSFQQAPLGSEQWTDESRMTESVVLDKLIDALSSENEFARTVNGRVSEELTESV